MVRAALRIEVTTRDRKELQKLLSGGVQQVRVVLRAIALLQLAKGSVHRRIAGMVPLTAQAIRTADWSERSTKNSGSSPWSAALPRGFARWTVRLVAEEAVKRRLVPRVGRETIRILLLSHDLKPWREKNVVRGRTQ